VVDVPSRSIAPPLSHCPLVVGRVLWSQNTTVLPSCLSKTDFRESLLWRLPSNLSRRRSAWKLTMHARVLNPQRPSLLPWGRESARPSITKHASLSPAVREDALLAL